MRVAMGTGNQEWLNRVPQPIIASWLKVRSFFPS
jgi:hypothetical protein